VPDPARFEKLVADGASIARMSHELGISRWAVKQALERAGLRTERARRLEESRQGDRPSKIERRCVKHGVAEFSRDANGTYRCLRCSSDAVSRRRRKVKELLVAEAGGRCALCGYDRCVRALAFHHLDPLTKRFGLAAGGLARSLAESREEVAKCVLLCANCHAEVEAGIAVLPPIPSLG
jgi:DNA-directed RNA polymerase subunit RPC12/RpoP